MYLLLPNVQVQRANAQAASWLVNAAPIMASTMFGHNLGRNLGAECEGVAILHHDAQYLGEYFYGKWYPQQRRGAMFIDQDDYTSKNKHILSLQPTVSCHLCLTLVLKFNDLIDLNLIKPFMDKARLAGGQIIHYGEPESFELLDEVYRSQHLKLGFWLVERQDLMTQGSDPLDSLLSKVGTKAKPKADKSDIQNIVDEEAALPESWFVPVTLGYALITSLAHRSGVREGYQHAFAETLVGLAQYVSVRDFGEQSLPFWHYKWLSHDVFVVKQA